MFDIFSSALKGVGNSFRSNPQSFLSFNNANSFIPAMTNTAGNIAKSAVKSPSFFDNLTNGTKWLFSNQTDKNVNITASPFSQYGGLAMGAYGAYNQQKMAKKNFDLQQQAFNYNIAQNEELKKRQDAQTKKLASIWGD